MMRVEHSRTPSAPFRRGRRIRYHASAEDANIPQTFIRKQPQQTPGPARAGPREDSTMALVSVSRAASALGVGDDTVRRWVKAGRLPSSEDPLGRLLVEVPDDAIAG